MRLLPLIFYYRHNRPPLFILRTNSSFLVFVLVSVFFLPTITFEFITPLYSATFRCGLKAEQGRSYYSSRSKRLSSYLHKTFSTHTLSTLIGGKQISCRSLYSPHWRDSLFFLDASSHLYKRVCPSVHIKSRKNGRKDASISWPNLLNFILYSEWKKELQKGPRAHCPP